MKEHLLNVLLSNLKPPCIKDKAYKSSSKYFTYILYGIALPALTFSIMIALDLHTIFLFNSDNKVSQYLNEIIDFINNYKLWLISSSIMVIGTYLLVRKIVFGINIQGQWNDAEYVQYLKKTWIKYFSQEKDKNLIFKALKNFCKDHTILISNWQEFQNCGGLDEIYKEHLIKTMFDLLECCVEIDNEVAIDHIITQLQNLFDKNKRFITERIEDKWDHSYIRKNRDKLKRIYDACALSASYEANYYYVRFHNKYSNDSEILSYNDFILNEKIDLLRKLRIIWLIYESDSASRGDILQKIKILPGVHPKIIDFINVLLEEKKIPQNTSSKTTIVEKNPTTGDMPND